MISLLRVRTEGISAFTAKRFGAIMGASLCTVIISTKILLVFNGKHGKIPTIVVMATRRDGDTVRCKENTSGYSVNFSYCK